MRIAKLSFKKIWSEYRLLIIFLAVMVLFRSAIADWNQVPTGSMKPSILEGDRVLVNKLAYDLKVPFTRWQLSQWAHPERGEIVTFASPRDGRLLIKRVIGIPGDTISMRNNQLYIDGQRATYDELDAELGIIQQLDLYQRHRHAFFFEVYGGIRYPVMVRPATPTHYSSFAPVRIPEGFYMMLGDNRDNSADSRIIGLISRELIMGRAHTVAFSIDSDDYYLPRSGRFILPLEWGDS